MHFKKSMLWNSVNLVLKNQSNKKLWVSLVITTLSQPLYAQDPSEATNSIFSDEQIESFKTYINHQDFAKQFDNVSFEKADIAFQKTLESEKDMPNDLGDPNVPVIQVENKTGENNFSIVKDKESERNFFQKIKDRFSSVSNQILKLDNVRVRQVVVNAPKNQSYPIRMSVPLSSDEEGKNIELTKEQYEAATKLLQRNIKDQLSSFNTDVLSSAASVVNHLEVQAKLAAEAVGFYNSQIKIEVNSDNKSVDVTVTPQFIGVFSNKNYLHVIDHPDDILPFNAKRKEYDGTEGLKKASFVKITDLLPDFKQGDVLNHGLYETTRKRVEQAAEDDGYFESYWYPRRSQDSTTNQIVSLPLLRDIDESKIEGLTVENDPEMDWEQFDIEMGRLETEINEILPSEFSDEKMLELYPAVVDMVYVLGPRYQLGQVNFYLCESRKNQTQTCNPIKSTNAVQDNSQTYVKSPVRVDVLENMVPWLLPHENKSELPREVKWKRASNYTAQRMNSLTSSLAASRYFNSVEVTRRPDIYKIKQEARRQNSQELLDLNHVHNLEGSGIESSPQSHIEHSEATMSQINHPNDSQSSLQQDLETQFTLPDEKVINVDVRVTADSRNAMDLGLGYGTDTGARLRSQYYRSIVNDRGHSFESNLELAESRQAVDGRYMIPHYHAVNDHFSLVAGYEREERRNVVEGGVDFLIESAVAGIDHVYNNTFIDWQHTLGLRYRLDRIDERGNLGAIERLDAFMTGGSEQQSLLLHGELKQSSSDDPIKPRSGFKQIYKVELGAKSLLTDANIAKLNAQWTYLKSFGQADLHQFLGEAEVGYIFTDDFSDVPYNLRYFTGGDESIRGFDYKSLSPIENGVKIGGQALARTSLEYNYEFKPNWRAAVFSDIGNAYNEKFNGETAYGAGLGIRWMSPVGMVRMDVASGLSDEDKPIRLHFFIGSQF